MQTMRGRGAVEENAGKVLSRKGRSVLVFLVKEETQVLASLVVSRRCQ